MHNHHNQRQPFNTESSSARSRKHTHTHKYTTTTTKRERERAFSCSCSSLPLPHFRSCSGFNVGYVLQTSSTRSGTFRTHTHTHTGIPSPATRTRQTPCALPRRGGVGLGWLGTGQSRLPAAKFVPRHGSPSDEEVRVVSLVPLVRLMMMLLLLLVEGFTSSWRRELGKSIKFHPFYLGTLFFCPLEGRRAGKVGLGRPVELPFKERTH